MGIRTLVAIIKKLEGDGMSLCSVLKFHESKVPDTFKELNLRQATTIFCGAPLFQEGLRFREEGVQIPFL